MRILLAVLGLTGIILAILTIIGVNIVAMLKNFLGQYNPIVTIFIATIIFITIIGLVYVKLSP